MDISQIKGLPEVINSIGIYFNVTPHVDWDTTYSGSGVKMLIYNGNIIPIQWYFKGQKGYATAIQNTTSVIIPAQDATLSYRCLIAYKPFTNTIVERHSSLATEPADLVLYDDEISLSKFIVPAVGSGIVSPPPSSVYELLITPGTTSQYWRGDKTWQTLNKSAVGLGNVDNTADSAKNVLSATKLTTARTINGVSFDGSGNITITDSTKEPAFAAGTTLQYLRGDKTWQTLPTSGSVWNDFLPITSTTPASTSTLNRTGSNYFTTILKIGYGLKYKIAGVYYYGIVTAVTSTLLTVAGIPLSGAIQEIYYCDQSNVMRQDLEINNSDWLVPLTNILVDGYTKHPLKAPSGWLVMIETWSAGVDSGTTKGRIKLMNGNNTVSSVPDGIECTTAKTYNNSGVTIQSAYYKYAGGDNVRVDITQPGSNKDTTEAKFELYWILE
jgi:hypothetical protein